MLAIEPSYGSGLLSDGEILVGWGPIWCEGDVWFVCSVPVYACYAGDIICIALFHYKKYPALDDKFYCRAVHG